MGKYKLPTSPKPRVPVVSLDRLAEPERSDNASAFSSKCSASADEPATDGCRGSSVIIRGKRAG